MNSDKLRYFIEIARQQNLTKAANYLFTSQPALTQYVNRLETEIGLKLFDRSSTPLRLTEAGELYLKYAHEVVAAQKELNTGLELLKHQIKQTLTIGIPSQMIPFVSAHLLNRFIHLHPDIHLIIREGTSLSLMNDLLTGEIDLAFLHNRNSTDSRCVRNVLFYEPLYFVFHRQSKLGHACTCIEGNYVRLDQIHFPIIEKMRMIRLSKDFYLYHLLKEQLANFNIIPSNSMELPSLNAAIQYIAQDASDGIALLSKSIISTAIDETKLYFGSIAGQELSWNFSVNYMPKRTLSKIAVSFLAFADENKSSLQAIGR
ncbi:MAG: LysR family transcriptional regulator [Lachnospiraceae bacterium]|nr:LysR family transcriptional regulator [Lachnospiraceae bacterium]